MARLFADTDQLIEDELIARLDALPLARKLGMVAELSAAELGVSDLLARALAEGQP